MRVWFKTLHKHNRTFPDVGGTAGGIDAGAGCDEVDASTFATGGRSDDVRDTRFCVLPVDSLAARDAKVPFCLTLVNASVIPFIRDSRNTGFHICKNFLTCTSVLPF